MIKRYRQLTVTGEVYNDTKEQYPDGTVITLKDVTESDYRGRYLFGLGVGRDREYFVAHKISMKEEE